MYLYYEVHWIVAHYLGPKFIIENNAGVQSYFIISDQEPAECIMALGFMIFAIVVSRYSDRAVR
jgi:hypothetical protein